MNERPFSDLIFEALCTHEVFRKLGFTPDEIYFLPSTEKLFMVIKKGNLQFNFDVGDHDKDVASLATEWTKASIWWNEHPDGHALEEMYEKSKVRGQVVGIIFSLKTKGFSLQRTDA